MPKTSPKLMSLELELVVEVVNPLAVVELLRRLKLGLSELARLACMFV